jgi:hypothetical protein
MKKSLLLILAVFAFSFANAQGFKFGIKGGVNLSTFTGGDKGSIFGDTDYKTSYHFGIMPEFHFSDFLGLTPEILYTSKGAQNTYSLPGTVSPGGTDLYNDKINLNYLSVPLLIHINAGPVFFELGPEFAYLLAVTDERKIEYRKANGDKVTDSKTEKHTDKDDITGLHLKANDFDFGYVAGIGVNLPAGFGLGARYNGGFISIFDTKDANGDKLNVKNSNFMFSLSYTFGGHETE